VREPRRKGRLDWPSARRVRRGSDPDQPLVVSQYAIRDRRSYVTVRDAGERERERERERKRERNVNDLTRELSTARGSARSFSTSTYASSLSRHRVSSRVLLHLFFSYCRGARPMIGIKMIASSSREARSWRDHRARTVARGLPRTQL